MDLKPFLKNKWLLVLGGLGILFLVLGTFWNGKTAALATLAPHSANASSTASSTTSNQQPTTQNPAIAYESSYDKQLTTMLSQIQGINQVSVMVTLDTTESLQLAGNTTTTTQTQNSGSNVTSQSQTQETQIFTEHLANGSSVPYVVKKFAPSVRGVLVTVNATDFYVAKAEIIDAIQHVLDVPAYKISVEPKKNNS
ncbi:hypothetical protein LLE49_02405 [Alicyclobacillus tolerans]|uniref:hypothetical protein n=1 Tax=Alicyclobacillus tolerans TaxID=90970 RepID=UPI001F1FF349|nr:hypothetical protein [Alicyclobacillus tolerans]MCF8563589.1 hypothetical protein [Alicyclobacillus tolerans]